MKYVVVDSSNIACLGHDAVTNTLSVVFKSKAAYFYPGVPVDIFDRFIASDSKGRFFSASVKDKYACFQLEQVELFPEGSAAALATVREALAKLP